MILKNLENNILKIRESFGNSKDLIVKQFFVGKLECAVVYLKGMVDVLKLTDFVVKPMQQFNKENLVSVDYILNNIISFPEINKQSSFKEVVSQISKGKVCLLFQKENVAYLLELDLNKERAISEPPTSAVLKGPRAGFNENLKTNLSIIRKILATNQLETKMLTVGKLTTTQVCVLYLKNIVDKSLVKKIVNKINSISIDGIIDSYYIAEFLKQKKHSMFKQVGNTEKPDIACAKILEGRILILVDGSPIALTLPYVLLEDFQAADDYYNTSVHSTFVRFLRVVSALITVMLPGLYIAMQLYHYKAIPLKFLITITNSTQGLPLTPVTEILFVLVLFEILYEASLRMPEYLGIALSVVGALILGDTAVKAGLISSPSVMIVALSGITLYTIPDQAQQLSLLRFVFTIAGSLLGFYGIILLCVFFITYLCDFDQYKTSYLAPFAPTVSSDLKDSLIKKPLVEMINLPKSFPNKFGRRQK